MTWTGWTVAAALVIALAAVACGKQASAGGKPKVVVSIFPIYDLTRRIAGDRADVHLVLPVGKSEHAYEATPKEIAKLEGASLGIAVGLDMDLWVETLMKSAGGARFIRIGDQVETLPIDVDPITEAEAAQAHDHDHDHARHARHARHATIGSPDPHVWMDPARMVPVIDRIASELATLDPKSKDTFVTNGEALKAALRDLDAKLATRSKAWTKRTIVTFHGSMQYFARRYGIRIAAVVEPLAGKEPTPAYIGQVIAAIKRAQAAALFTEPQLDRAPGEMLAKEAGIPLGELDPIGGVAGRDSYEALLTWNTEQLEKALR